MNYDWKNMDLKNACIFDLTDDIKLIRKVVCDRTITLKDKDIYISEYSQIRIACDMCDFAERIKDQQLINELEKIFKAEYAEYDAMFNE
jgi:hypothetical protein